MKASPASAASLPTSDAAGAVANPTASCRYARSPGRAAGAGQRRRSTARRDRASDAALGDQRRFLTLERVGDAGRFFRPGSHASGRHQAESRSRLQEAVARFCWNSSEQLHRLSAC